MSQSVNFGLMAGGVVLALLGMILLLGWLDWTLDVLGVIFLAIGAILFVVGAAQRQLGMAIGGIIPVLFGIVFIAGWMNWTLNVLGIILLAVGVILFIVGFTQRKSGGRSSESSMGY